MKEWMASNNDSRLWNVYEKADDGSWVGVAVAWSEDDARDIAAVPELLAVLAAAFRLKDDLIQEHEGYLQRRQWAKIDDLNRAILDAWSKLGRKL